MGRGHTKVTLTPAIWGGGTVERALRLDATALIRAVRRQQPELWRSWEATGEATLAPVAVPATRDGVPNDPIAATVALHGPRAAAALPDGHSVALVMRRSNTGGLRFWWSFPPTGDRCRDLYLPDNAERFASRRAHGLRYRSTFDNLAERAERAERAARRARRLRRALGDFWGALGGPLPDRPLRMREATHRRLCDAIRAEEAEALAVPA